MIGSSRKRRRKPCWCIAAAAALTLAGHAHAQDEEQQPAQPFETVPVSRYGDSSASDVSIAGTSRSASSGSAPANATLSAGRYGHAAVWQQDRDRVLFIGGQVGTSGTFVTNDVLALDLSQSYASSSSNGALSLTLSRANPALVPELSAGLPPNAWTAYGLDEHQDGLWLIGGVTQDCENDAAAYVLDSALDTPTWTAVELGNFRAPRRRQAQAVAVVASNDNASSTSDATRLYVFGGIAEPYTCSLDTVGYLAMDIWNVSALTASNAGRTHIETISWSEPRAALRLERTSDYNPAISDYAAVSLPDLEAVAYIGGQDATGKLASMEEVLLFDTATNVWQRQTVTGDIPARMMGHSATRLQDGRIVVYGGLGSDGTPLSSLHVLSIDADGDWRWSTPETSQSEMQAPLRAWHSATLVKDGIIVFGFGLDASTGQTVDGISFLQTSNSSTGWRWTAANPLAQSADEGTAVVQNAGNSQAVQSFVSNGATLPVNPKAAQATLLRVPGENDNNASPSPTNPKHKVYSSSLAATRAAGTHAASDSGSGEQPSPADAAAQKSKVIAGSVTAAFLAALVAGGGALYVRKRAAASAADESKPIADNDATNAPPPVSELLYTRAAPKRMLSLGSAFSVHTVRSLAERQDKEQDFQALNTAEARAAVLGLAGAAGIARTTALDTQQQHTAQPMSHSASADSTETRASVASYPFLTSVPREADAFSSEISHEGQDLGLTLLRTHSNETMQSNDSSLAPTFVRWPSMDSLAGHSGQAGSESDVGSEIVEVGRSDPFGDMHEVLPDLPRSASFDQTARLSHLPPSLRAGPVR